MKRRRMLLAIAVSMFMLLGFLPGVVLAQNDVEANYAFVPNHGDASVSKVDLMSGEAVARYYTAPRQGQEVDQFGEDNSGVPFPINPFDWRTSRLAIDPDGNAWAVNTGVNGTGLQGSVARIQGDTTGLTNTNDDHDVPLDFGQDEAVTVFAVGAPGDVPRTINFDVNGNAWIGFHMENQKYGYFQKYEYTGTSFDPVGDPVGGVAGDVTPEYDLAPYYAQIDKNGILWFAVYGSSAAGRFTGTYAADHGVYSFDTRATDPASTIKKHHGVSYGYGILVDNGDPEDPEDPVIVYATDHRVNGWFYKLDTTGGNDVFVGVAHGGLQGPRGMAFDEDGNIWIASTGNNRVAVYRTDASASSWTGFGNNPIGVGRDASGKMWVIIRNDGHPNGFLRGFDPSNPTDVVDIAVGDRPYGYGGFIVPAPPEELTVTKTVVTYFERTHEWDIEKWVTTENGHEITFEEELTPKIWLYAGGDGDETATWHVLVSYEGFDDHGFNVSGTITIENPGAVAAVITDVVDKLAGEEIDVIWTHLVAGDWEEIPDPVFPYTLEPGDKLIGHYDEDVDTKIEGDNEVTVTTERDVYTAEEEIEWADEPDEEHLAVVTVEDDSDLFGEVELGTLDAADSEDDGFGEFSYDWPFAWQAYDEPGPYVYDNEATIVETEQSATARLVVNWVDRYDDTVWAYGGVGEDDGGAETDVAKHNNKVTGNPSNAWGWTNFIDFDLLEENDGEFVMELWAGAGRNLTDNGQLVGTVTVTVETRTIEDVDYDCVIVTYAIFGDLDPEHKLSETHLWVGFDPLPTWEANRGRSTVTVATAAPGQLEGYVEGAISKTMVDDFTVEYTVCFEQGALEDGFWVAAHGVVVWFE